MTTLKAGNNVDVVERCCSFNFKILLRNSKNVPI